MLFTLKTLAAIELLLAMGLVLYRLALRRRFKQVVDAKAITLLTLTPAVALLVGNIYIFYAYLVAAVAFTSRNRAELCATYVLLLPAMPMLAMATAFGTIYLLPLSAVMMMNVGALIGFAIIPRRGPAPVRAPFDWAAIALLLLFTFIDSRGVSATSIARTFLTNVIWIGGPYLLLSRGITRPDHLERVLLRLGLIATVGALVAVFETVKHWVLFQSFYDNLHVPLPMLSATLNLRGGLLRSGGPIIDYTAAGIFFAVAVVSMPWLFGRFRSGWRWLIVAVLVAGLGATLSRGAWIGAGAGFAFLLLYRGAWAKLGVAVGAALAAQAVAFAAFSSQSRWAEVIGAGGNSASTADYRERLFWRGLDQLRAHPWLGQPPQQLTDNMEDMRQGQHIVDFVNTHLYIGMVAGVPFLCVWAMIWGLPMFRAWRLRRTGTATMPSTAELPAATILTVSIALAATSLTDRNLLWLIIGLALTGPCFAFAGRRPAPLRAPTPARRPKLVVGLPGHMPPPVVT